MRALSVSELLDVWERGLSALPYERALSLLSAASPESSLQDLASLTISKRDAHLLQLREWAFGPEITLLAECPSCTQTLEVVLPAPALKPSTALLDKVDLSLVSGDYEIRYRLPDSTDLAACAAVDAPRRRDVLLARCVTEVRCKGEAISPQLLNEELLGEIENRMAATDPHADTRLELTCPECQRGWKQLFDIVSFFWLEIDAWARRTLLDVSVLARTYGWSEGEILALSPARRQIYLAMAEA